MAKRKSNSSANSGKSVKKTATRRTEGAGTFRVGRSPEAQGQMPHEGEFQPPVQSVESADVTAFEACLELADSNASLATRIIFVCRAVELGRQLLGQNHEQNVGEFWLAPECRPLMRAKAALAHSLSENNELAEAEVAAVGAETWSVLFNEAGEVPPADLRRSEARGLPVAGDSAFPSTFHLQRGEVEQVDRRSLVAITLCLQAVEQAARQRSSGNKWPIRLELPGWGRLVQAQVRPV